jgi:hypothetical protein
MSLPTGINPLSIALQPGIWFRIKSKKGTVLDDWGGKTGENSASLQPDDSPLSNNRIWRLIPTNFDAATGTQWYRIRSTKGTVLDDWGGKTGENSAALQPDDVPDSNNRKWQFVPVEDGSWFRIKSTKGTVLDDWGGKTGENSAALQHDDTPDSNNRKWQLIPVTLDVPVANLWYRIKSTKGTVLDDWGGKTGENSAALQPDDVPESNNRKWKLVPVGNGWFRIKSTKGTVLDDWAGKTGQNSAALQPDDVPDSNNRKWELVPVGASFFRIRNTKGTVLDDWGGKTGEDSAALQPDDVPDSNNRKWQFIPTHEAH